MDRDSNSGSGISRDTKASCYGSCYGTLPCYCGIWGLLMVESTLRSAGTTLFIIGKDAFANNLAIHGMISLERGFIFTSMILASISVFLIEKKFFNSVYNGHWERHFSLFVGIIHAYELTPGGVASVFRFGAANDFAIGYCSFAIYCSLPYIFICMEMRKNQRFKNSQASSI